MNSAEITAIGTAIVAFGVMGTGFLLVTRSIVRDEIAKLNGTYIRRELADERHRSIWKKILEIDRHLQHTDKAMEK